MFNSFLFIISFSLSLNELIPDKANAILLQEYEIKCPNYGSQSYIITYKINNYQSKRYFQLVKNRNIREFYLYKGDTKLSYETNTDYDYFYPITSNNILYLVVNHISSYCISFKFINSNTISLINNEEYKYPIVTSNQYIIAKVTNVANKHFIFYLNHTYSNRNAGYGIEVNGVSYNKYPGTKIFSLLPQKNELDIKIKPPGEKIIATFRYISVPYSNITDDTIQCSDYSYYMKSFIINKSTKYYLYYWYFLSNNKIEYYDNDILKSELSNLNLFTNYNYEHFILLKDIGCFQIKYTNKTSTSNIELKKKDSFLVSNSEETYNFILYENRVVDEKYMNMSICSNQNNFINKLKIKNSLQKLIIKNNNYSYCYIFLFTIDSSDTSIKINFDLNENHYIIIYFEIEEYFPTKKNENDDDNSGTFYTLITLGIIFFIIFACFIFKYLRKNWEKKKIEKKEEQRLLEIKNHKKLLQDFCRKIKQDYTNINKICLLCLNKDSILNLENIDSDNDSILDYNKRSTNNIINDINSGIFKNFMNYITPKKCSHLYHKSCGPKPQKCLFCEMFITPENVKKFGFFFSADIILKILGLYEFYYTSGSEELKEKVFLNIKNIFYSKVEKSYEINKEYKANLMKIKDLNEKYNKNLGKNLFKYYDLNIDDDLIREENELINKIEEEEERRQRRKEEEEERRQRREEEEEEDRYYENVEDDYYERKRPQNTYNNYYNQNKSNYAQKYKLAIISPRFCKDCSRFCCIFCKKRSKSGVCTFHVHSECVPKNFRNYCFICNKSLPRLAESTCHYCHDCAELIGEKNVRKTCPVCRKKVLTY